MTGMMAIVTIRRVFKTVSFGDHRLGVMAQRVVGSGSMVVELGLGPWNLMSDDHHVNNVKGLKEGGKLR
jgi:hypothetical protein